MAATLVGFAGLTAQGQTSETSDLLPLLPQWDHVITLRSATGYKDNILLSHAAPQGGAFVTGGAEVLVLRLPTDGTEFNFFGDVDATRYFSSATEHTEVTAFGLAELKHQFNERWRGLLAAEYFYQDQVIDVSVSTTNRESAPVIGHTATLRPGVRLTLSPNWWTSLEVSGTRRLFEQPLDNDWHAQPKATLGFDYGRGSEITLSYEPSWWTFDTDRARTAAGNAITNLGRFRFEQEARLRWKHYWDESRRWRTTLTVSGRLNEENGGGYYDYSRWLVSARVRYRKKPWDIYAEARVAGYDYATQTVSATDPAKRRRTEWSLELHAERQLTQHLTLTAGIEHEEALSNDELETYTVTTVNGGLNWEF